MKNLFTAKNIAKLGMFGALSFALYMFPKFPLPFTPHFLEMNFSDVPALICGFNLGPVAAAITVLIKILLKLPFSATAFVGELGDLIIGGSFAVVPAVIYKRYKSIGGAVIGLAAGTIASTAAAMLTNLYILIPAYAKAMGGMDLILSWCRPFAPDITEQNFFTFYLFYMVLPFNLIRCVGTGILTFLLYKRISKLLNRF